MFTTAVNILEQQRDKKTTANNDSYGEQYIFSGSRKTRLKHVSSEKKWRGRKFASHHHHHLVFTGNWIRREEKEERKEGIIIFLPLILDFASYFRRRRRRRRRKGRRRRRWEIFADGIKNLFLPPHSRPSPLSSPWKAT